ncbi:MAG: DUF2231 domain-containing protein [Melioribacteraceae bacterium]|nr:DUF2231 domain-containing protein [Melioribacteraceae bacterium]MCF8355661.1 DUF2231 domain-containing protein [Melioribacteraceae bacterium]MCF8395137.1 DUF2231 domain-containing protein [Melioribacteraceae bacterium]MCF8420569.1 DUF2231 domain-containing protein [Melioribacteraceae bacterium]
MEFLAGLHPKVVHFPIVLFLFYIVFETISIVLKKEEYSNSALIILAFGVIASLAAVLTGNQAESVAKLQSIEGSAVPLDLLETHSDYANIMMWYFFSLLVLKIYFLLKKKIQPKIKLLFVILGIVGFIFVYLTAHYGGKLVFDHGVGTNLIEKIVK